MRKIVNKVISYPSFGLLLVDDEVSYLRSLSLLLERKGGINHIHCCDDSRKVMDILAGNNIGIVLLDLTMPHISGLELLEKIHNEYPDISVIIISGLNNVSSAVTCLKKGAFDYYVKTTEEDRLLEGIKRTILMQYISYENRSLKAKMLDDKLQHPEVFEPIISRSKAMNAIFHYIESIALSVQPIMIMGESGSGKELIAKACHEVSNRQGSLVTVNVAGLDDDMFSDTLFGHQQGAFTGATRNRKGLIEKAAGGTLFLDEIGDLSMQSQVKLLRLLQEGEYYPLGSDMPKRSHARIIVATHQNMESQRDSGQFRKDLYYRLCTHMIKVPPLRSRKMDIPVLLDHFLGLAANDLKKPIPSYPPELPVLLCNYDFPGNVRELRALVYDAVSRHRSRLLSMEVFKSVLNDDAAHLQLTLSPDPVSFNANLSLPTLSAMDDFLIAEAMQRSGNNQSLASRMLGISQPALSKRLKKNTE
jgi:DNA-binding NtrC family response regulator